MNGRNISNAGIRDDAFVGSLSCEIVIEKLCTILPAAQSTVVVSKSYREKQYPWNVGKCVFRLFSLAKRCRGQQYCDMR